MVNNIVNQTGAAGKITWTLFTAQSLTSAGTIGIATVNTIVGASLSSNPAWAGLPSAIYLLGSAMTAPLWGWAMDRVGRRNGLAAGLGLGMVGVVLAAYAVVSSSFLYFCIGMALVGNLQAAMQLGRFASAEVHPPTLRGRAISNVVLGGTVGAIVGPLSVGISGKFVTQAGYNELLGPYVFASLVFTLATLVILAMLRPDPRELGREISRQYPEDIPVTGNGRPPLVILRQPAALVSVTAMVIGQMVMVMVMVITSLHMHNHQHGLNSIALVMSFHTVGMFAFSLVSGRMADRWGRVPVILVGATTLILACLTAPLSPHLLPLSISLFLLGLGWNFCFVGGSSLLADQLSPAERARTQGLNDLIVGLASATGSLSSGIAFALVGYGLMGILGALLALLPLSLALRWQINNNRLVTSS
jgi:MFS family permease